MTWKLKGEKFERFGAINFEEISINAFSRPEWRRFMLFQCAPEAYRHYTLL
jgi:hypothetical protein